MKQNTMLESAIERRNFYQGRMVENMVNIIYFTRQIDQHKPDTQERVNAKEAVKNAEEAWKNDQKLMEAFDILINELMKPVEEPKVEPATKPAKPTKK
jgi:hypothetical protein